MATAFLASHGIDIDAIMSKIQSGDDAPDGHLQSQSTVITKIVKARLPDTSSEDLYDISIENGNIISVHPHASSGLNITRLPGVLDAEGGLVTPSLCHAHVHLDKCFLLHDDKYNDLEIIKGDFAEAMSLTGEAKQRFEEDDLLCRGRRLIQESSTAGVTVMRAFVEVDEVAQLKCVKAGLLLKEQFRETCHIQVCAFAQLALFSGEDGGEERRSLLEEALQMPGVDVVGSTPYVEDDEEKMKRNVEWTIVHALATHKHIDFHLDYNINPDTEPLVWYVLKELKKQEWKSKADAGKTICLGHCTRLTLFSTQDWQRLHDQIGDLPVTFIGLPTSDLFMMGRPKDSTEGGGQRPRATMQIPEMIERYNLNGAISINNVGNAFTPYGTCDPLSLASLAVGVYQAGTKHDTELIYVRCLLL